MAKADDKGGVGSDDAHNEARRRQYREDANYRESTKQRYRDSYRKRAWGSTKPKNPIRRNLKAASKFGTIRKVGSSRCRTYTVPEMATLLKRSLSIYKRWLAAQQVPTPAHETVNGKVYKMAEALAVAKVLAEHFDGMNYYRQDHVATKAALWDAYWESRKPIGKGGT